MPFRVGTDGLARTREGMHCVRVAFDSRAKGDPRGIGRYVRCLLEALRETAEPGSVITETHRPRRSDVFHSPWLDGASLRSPCPTVVTLHDLVNLKRRAEYLRTGIRFKLRYLAVQRADRVIVPTRSSRTTRASAWTSTSDRISVISEAAAAAMYPRGPTRWRRSASGTGCPSSTCCGSAACCIPSVASASPSWPRRPGECRSCWSGRRSRWAYELPDVTLTGQVSDDELAALYSGAHALVFPSDDEGFGLPTVEALACGTPVVACDVPACGRFSASVPRSCSAATWRACSKPGRTRCARRRRRRPGPGPTRLAATWGVYAAAAEQSQSISTRRVPRLPRGAF